MSALLVSVALISLIVSSIGIMNIMLVTVTERTHEIGWMKSIGFTYYDVLMLFIVGSIIVGILGGILGTVLGMSGAFIANTYLDLPNIFPVELIIAGFSIAVLVGLLAGAGFAGIVLGLAAQSTLSNVIAGISLATFRPFRVGDRVTINNEYGMISDITLGHTVVATWDNRRLIIPNHIISDQSIINWTVDMGISYDSDIDHAKSIMIEETKNHPNVTRYKDIIKYYSGIGQDEDIEVM